MSLIPTFLKIKKIFFQEDDAWMPNLLLMYLFGFNGLAEALWDAVDTVVCLVIAHPSYSLF